MAEVARTKGPLTPDGVAETAKPPLIALGLLVLAWNDMQEKLAELFWAVTGIPNGRLPLAIWHSLRDDRTQRIILQAALESGLGDRPQARGKDGLKWLKKAKQNINWLLGEVNGLVNDRNNFVHAPFMFKTETDDETSPLEMTPFDFFWNPKATALKGKALMDVMACHRHNTAALGTFALALKMKINNPSDPWPTKPHKLSVEEFRRHKETKDRPKRRGPRPSPAASSPG